MRDRSTVSGHEKPRLTESRAGIDSPDRHKSIRVLEGQRTQHDAVHDREDRRGHADRTGETHDRACKHARRASQAAKCDAHSVRSCWIPQEALECRLVEGELRGRRR